MKNKSTHEGRNNDNILHMNLKVEEFHENDSNKSIDDIDSLSDHANVQEEQEDQLSSKASQMPLHCLVPECGKSQADHPDKVFFMLPADEEKLQHWLLVCRRSDLMKNFKNILDQQYGICEDHFITDNFLDGSKQELKYEAIPTLFSNNEKYSLPFSDHEQHEFVPGECDIYIKQEVEDHDELFFEGNSADGEEDNINLLCRLCASRMSDVVYIFNDTGQEQQIAKKINTCLPVTVRKTDPLPKQLCMSCVAKLNLCHEFAEACIRAEDKLLSLNGKNHFRSQVLSSDSSGYVSKEKDLANMFNDRSYADDKLKYSQNTDVNSKDSDDEKWLDPDLDAGKNYCCPLCFKGNMTIKEHEGDTGDGAEGDPTPFSDSGVQCSDSNESSKWQSNTNEAGDCDEDIKHDMTDSNSASNPPNNSEGNDDLVGNITCRMCGDAFENVYSCMAHATSHYESDFYPCCLCDLCFSSKSSLREHTSKQHAEAMKAKGRTSKRLSCSSCGKLFNSEKTLNSHACGSSPRPYKCQECGKSFLTQVRLAFHQQMHQAEGILSCEHCGKIFSRENNLYDHVRLVHMGEKAHCCDLCGKTFQLKSRLVAHQRVHTGERPFECDICGGKFYDKATLKGHHLTHLDVKPFQCEICGRCFARKTLFQQHAKAHVSDNRKVPRTYACRICGGTFVFSSYAKLMEHRREKHPESEMNEVDENSHVSKPFKCEDCGKSFAYRVTLVAHRRNHTGELPFQCEYCAKKFAQKRSLILHRRTHTGEKPFVCLECGKRFVQSAHLYSHARLHTGEKPYSCEVCGDSFRLKDVRDAHQRKHTGERPFKCNVCGKAFRTSHSYYQHMWIHQGKKPYPCSYCGKAFRRSNGLKIHIRIHTGEKPHACDVCGRSFAQKQDMKKHRNLHVVGKL